MYLGMDIGGTKIDICLYGEKLDVVEKWKYATKDYRIRSLDFVEDIKTLIGKHITKDVTRIGFSLNCAFKNGIVTYSSLLGGAVNYPMEKELEKHFGIPTKTDDDLHALAVAEARIGKGKGVDSFLLINLGTGIGVGYWENGRLVRGYNNNAGIICIHKMWIPELNDFVITDDIICGKGLSLLFERFSGLSVPAKEVFQRAAENDENAKKSLELFEKYFSEFLFQVSCFYNPRHIIINGSLKHAAPLYLPGVEARYKKEAMHLFHFETIGVSELDYGAGQGVLLQFDKETAA